MPDIPEDVMKAARKARPSRDLAPHLAVEKIARAIMAERERHTELLDALTTLVAVLPDAALNEPTGGALSLAKSALSKAEGKA